MPIEDRLRRALDEAAQHVNVDPPPLTPRSASISLQPPPRRRSRFVLATAAVLMLVVAGVWVFSPTSTTTFETQQTGQTSLMSVPPSTTAHRPSTTAAPATNPVAAAATSIPASIAPSTTVLAPTLPGSTDPELEATDATFMPSPSTTDPFPAATPPLVAEPLGPLSMRCDYTDPGKRDITISVSKAMNCPDGESVIVHGVAFTDDEGNGWLCDAEMASTSASCAISGLRLLASPSDGEGDYRGVISNGALRVTATGR